MNRLIVKLFACAALMSSPSYATPAAERFAVRLESAKETDASEKAALVEAIENETKSKEAQAVVKKASQQVLEAAVQPDSAKASEVKPYVERVWTTHGSSSKGQATDIGCVAL